MVGVVAVLAGLVDRSPIAAADRSPAATRSWYVRSAQPSVFDETGCATGRTAGAAGRQQRSGVVLIFGGFAKSPEGRWVFDLYSEQAVPVSAVEQAVEAYVAGVERCWAGSSQPLTLVVGTTTSSGAVTLEAGATFARVVDDIARSVAGRSSHVTLFAGNDIELGYVGPKAARAWVDGYHAISQRSLVNYGDLAGCPSNRMPAGGDCGSRVYPEWSAEDVWYVAGHPNTINFPGIYVITGVQARQWLYLSRYGVARHGRPLKFLGALSQIAACQERPCSRWTRNSSEAAWRQLRSVISVDPALGPADLAVSDIAWMPPDAPPPAVDTPEAASKPILNLQAPLDEN